jgi:DNA polymerase III delta subunit
MAKKSGSAEKAGAALPRVLVLHGREPFIRSAKTAELREALAAEHGGVDVFAFDGFTATAADVLDECRSFGLIAQHKMVVLDAAEQLIKEETRALFERYAEAPCEGATLVLRADTWRPGRLDKLVEKVGEVIKCEPPDERTAKKWVVERARSEHRAEIDGEAVELLVMRVGADLGKLDSELGKLSAAAGAGESSAGRGAEKSGSTGSSGSSKGGMPRITRALVEYFVGASREEQVWGIQSTLLTAGPEEALSHVRYVIDVSRQPAELVMYAMVDLARKVHAASRAMKQGVSPGALRGPLKLWGSSEQAILGAARQASPERALALFRECTEGLTRSRSSLGDVDSVIERLAVRFGEVLREPVGA